MLAAHGPSYIMYIIDDVLLIVFRGTNEQTYDHTEERTNERTNKVDLNSRICMCNATQLRIFTFYVEMVEVCVSLH